MMKFNSLYVILFRVIFLFLITRLLVLRERYVIVESMPNLLMIAYLIYFARPALNTCNSNTGSRKTIVPFTRFKLVSTSFECHNKFTFVNSEVILK